MTDENSVEIEIPFSLFEYLSSESSHVQTICRVCLSTDNNILYPLTSSKEDNVLSSMFANITTISVDKEDGLPNSACAKCQREIINCYEFKTKCIKSDYILKSVLKGEFTTKDDINSKDCIINKDEQLKEQVDNQPDSKYLEYLEDVISDDETLCMVQNMNKNNEETDILSKKSHNISGQKSSKLLNKTKMYSCAHCSKKFQKLKLLRAHLKKKHSNQYKTGHSCKQCKETFTYENDLRLHEMLHNKGPIWKCIRCHKEFNVKQTLRRHLKRHMEAKRFPCDLCGKTFVERYALIRHMRTHTNEKPEKKFACKLCGKRFTDRRQLSTHDARHSGSRPCACWCGKAFASPRLLASHARVHSDDKPYNCNYCDKRFRHESTRNTHHRTHTGERPYVCSVCGKTFIQNSNMTLHMRTHTGERPYACSQCDRKFSTSCTLKMHERTHTGERPFKCKVCGKSFARMNMKLHMRLHTGERPHACAVCPKRFTSASHLRDHCRLHTGEKPYECAVCSEKFTTKSHLLKHFKIHDKTKNKKKGVVMYRPYSVADQNNQNEIIIVKQNANDAENKDMNEVTLGPIHEGPMEVAQELMLQDDSNIKTEVIFLGNPTNIPANEVSFVNASDVNLTSDVNFVTVNQGGNVSIASSSAIVEGTPVKLYQLDQSLLQIHSTGGQLTISKITSKMTANF